MAINQLFSAFLVTKNQEHSLLYDFDGTLEDYLSSSKDSVITKLLQQLTSTTTSMRICTNLKFPITQNITNQLIRYKDSFKIPQPALMCPYVLYDIQDDKKVAFILVPNVELGYVYAKGLYYCLTEPDGFFDTCRNNMVALYVDETNLLDVQNSIEAILKGEKSTGAIQRMFDRKYLKDIDTMKMMCVNESQRMFASVRNKLGELEDRGSVIYDTVARCFLLKKCLYVQFMMNKTLLEIRFDGDIKAQRKAAKQYADAIPFVSYSELWRTGQNDPILEQDIKNVVEDIMNKEA